MNIFGIVGWKNSGKTTLVERLVSEITSRGFSVSTVKHAHHNFDLDEEGRDSFRHREAGASEVLLASSNRWALMHELRKEDEPTLESLLTKITPVDLILVEGFKNEKIPKIECHRENKGNGLIAQNNDTICALATLVEVSNISCDILDLDDTNAIADYILNHQGLQ